MSTPYSHLVCLERLRSGHPLVDGLWSALVIDGTCHFYWTLGKFRPWWAHLNYWFRIWRWTRSRTKDINYVKCVSAGTNPKAMTPKKRKYISTFHIVSQLLRFSLFHRQIIFNSTTNVIDSNMTPGVLQTSRHWTSIRHAFLLFRRPRKQLVIELRITTEMLQQ